MKVTWNRSWKRNGGSLKILYFWIVVWKCSKLNHVCKGLGNDALLVGEWVGRWAGGAVIYSDKSKNSPAVLQFKLSHIEFFTLASMTQRTKSIVIQIISLKQHVICFEALRISLYARFFRHFNYWCVLACLWLYLTWGSFTSWICKNEGLTNTPHPKNICVGRTSQQALIWKWILSGKARWLAKGNLEEMPHINDSNSHENHGSPESTYHMAIHMYYFPPNKHLTCFTAFCVSLWNLFLKSW